MASPNKDLKFNPAAYEKLGKLLMLAYRAENEAMSLAGHMMTLADMDKLVISETSLMKFRVKAENVMTRNGMSQNCIDTFWGRALEDKAEKTPLIDIVRGSKE
jgi:hypothetical protein